MPKRNLLLLSLITALSLVACVARDRAREAHRVGEVLDAVDRFALDRVDPEELTAAAIDGVVSQLDEHSAVLDGAARRDLEAALDQTFGGVGLELMAGTEGITVHAPVVGGPAWRAGVSAGDVIVAVDGVDVRGMSVRDAVAIMRGAVGATVVLTLRSRVDGDGIDGVMADGVRDLALVREAVKTESVVGDRRLPDGSWDWFVEGEEGVAILRITGFGDRTPEEMDAALATIAAASPRGLILDLRANPGGLLAAAVEVCDRFVADGTIVSMRRRGPGAGEDLEARRAAPGAALEGVPLAVLVDGLTASAAEIVAACLQDHGRAVIVGSRTFGKGTVQSIIPLSDGRRILKLTTAEYLRPNAGAIQRRPDGPWGVDPDAGWEIDVTAQVREALAAWRRRRDVPPPSGSAEAAESAAALPRYVDPVLARGLEAVNSGEAGFGGEKETPGDADDTPRSGEPAGPGDGRIG